jgi:GTP-binding protein
MINSIEFVRGVTGSTDFLKDERPQIAFAGRSNVGKSSLLNAITMRNGLVRTSKTPGKTQEINFYLANNSFYLVDLPGYGYAKLSEKLRDKLRKHISWYLLSGEAAIQTVVLIIDVSVGLKDFDRELLDIAVQQGYRIVIAANKIDKCTQKERDKAKKDLTQELPNAQLFFVSAKTGRGVKELRSALIP